MAVMPDASNIPGAVPQPGGGVASYNPGAWRGLNSANESLSEAGHSLSDAAATIAATNERQDMMVAQGTSNALAKQQQDMHAQAMSVKGGGAVGKQFIDDYMGKFKQAQTDLREKLTSPAQQRMFDQRAEITGLQFRGALLAHQSQQTDQYNNQTENDTIDLARRQFFDNLGNPDGATAAMAQMDWAINQKARRLHWSEQTTAETKAKYLGTVYKDAVSMMVERDPVGTLPALNKRLGVGAPPAMTGNPAIDGLDPGALVEYRHRAQSEVEQLANHGRAEEKARLAKAESAIKDLKELVGAGGKVSPEYAALVKAHTIGTPLEASAEALIKKSYFGAALGSKPLGDQRASIRQAKEEAVARGTDPEEMRMLSFLEGVTSKQEAAYKENPWAAASAFGRVEPTPEAKIGAPEQAVQVAASRKAKLPLIEHYSGDVPQSPLQPNEVAAFAEQTAKMPIERQAELLGALGAETPERSLPVLAEQIDKGNRPLALMLRLNDRTTAGRTAAEMVGKGAFALKQKTVAADDTKLSGWKAEITKMVAGSLGNPKDEQNVIDAAFYVRAAMDIEGDTPAGFTKDSSIERALRIVIGQPMERGGVKTILPRGMSQDDFDEKIRSDAVTSQIRDVVYIRGMPIPKEQFAYRLPTMGMRMDGAGSYVPISNNARVTVDQGGLVPLRLKLQ